MAGTAIFRNFLLSRSPFSINLCLSLPPAAQGNFSFFTSSTRTLFFPAVVTPTPSRPRERRLFCSNSLSSAESPRSSTKLVNFTPPDSDSDSDSDEDTQVNKKEIDKSKLPPPYDPFNKKPVIQEPRDPKNLQEVFHNMKTDSLMQNAVKMFDGLSKDGLTHEALELFAQIKDKGEMPAVIAHTAVIEAYSSAGQSREALKTYLRMLASGVVPNAYTYAVLIKGLAADGKYLGDAKKYVMEMMGKGMRPNAGVYGALFEGFVREQREEEGREFLDQMRAKGFVPNERDLKEVLSVKRGQVYRNVMSLLFGK